MVRKTRKEIDAEELARDKVFQDRNMDVNWIIQHYKPEEENGQD